MSRPRSQGSRCAAAGLLLAGLACAPAVPQRLPVLKQVDLPHSYYYREMYLPRVTAGPGSPAWSPDGRELVYSMQGGLWRQRLDSTTAEQLTAGPGYDFEPDWSRDGTRIVFVRYANDALELAVLEVATGTVTSLTRGGAVNVDPRWSPDGKRIAWVSTAGTGHFHVFVGSPDGGTLAGAAAWPERRSRITRYYYSAFDHELSPSWSPDGQELIYVGNPEVAYGTGGIRRRALEPGAEPVLLRGEETTWKARPDWSPDGKRVVYSSYAGRQWHQLWATTADGAGAAIPLGAGEYDDTSPRWSPDGNRIAFVSNRDGGPAIWLQDAVGGAQRRLEVRERRYLRTMSELRLRITDADGKTLPARIAVLGADGRSYAPDAAWLRADDSFDRRLAAFETHYFHSAGESAVRVPAGAVSVTVWHGPGYGIATRRLQAAAGEAQAVTISLEPLALPPGWRGRWRSGDVHVHMNYGGTYRNTPERLVGQAAAEDLDVVYNLVVNKEQRIPDLAYFSPEPDPLSSDKVLLLHGQEYHTSYWGHLGLLALNDHFLQPGYAGYPYTAAASIYPTNGAVADLAHRQGALVGYVHPFEEMPDPGQDAELTNALPVDSALGKIDYYEVLGFSDHRATAEVWYRLLNCGIRPAAAGGTDAMANFASMRGPVGLNRVYVLTESGSAALVDRRERWLAGLRAGHTMATNGPLLDLAVEGKPPGSELAIPAGGREVRYRGFMRSAVPVDHLELVQNGAVVRTIRLQAGRAAADFEGSIRVTGPGWLLLRAWNDGADPRVFDSYPYATTNPVFFTADRAAIHCGGDAGYFVAWLDRLGAAAEAHPDYNDAAERESTLAGIHAARAVFEARR